MLKLRFGEQALQICDVMLKDMADSKRIDDRIQSDIKVSPLLLDFPETRCMSLKADALDITASAHHLTPLLATGP